MIRLLLRRDQGTNNLIMPALIALLAGVVLRFIESGNGDSPLFAPDNPVGLWLIQNFTVWSLLLAGMVGSHYWLRAPRLHMALPLAAKSLWLTRMTAICIGCSLMLLVIALINSLGFEADRLTVNTTVWLGALRVFSVFLLMLMLLQTPAPTRRKLETTPWYVAYTVILWCLSAVWLMIGPRGLLLTVPTLAVALLLGHNIWRRLPLAFQLESVEPDGSVLDDPVAPGPTEVIESEPAAHIATPFPRNGSSATLLYGMLFRVMHNHWLGWLFMSVLAIYGLVFSVHYYRGNDPLVSLLYFFGFGFGSWNQCIMRIHAVDAWPISRRLIFAFALFPLLLPYLAGMTLGIAIFETKANKELLVQYENEQVEVPYEYRAIARDGMPPTITTTWGETYTPKGTHVFPWSEMVVYNPYEITHDTSTRFDAWQIDRAVAAVHGDPAPDPVFDATMEVNGTDGATKECCSFDLQSSRGRGSTPRDKTFALIVALFALLNLPLLLITTLAFDRRAPEWVRTRAVLTAIIIPISLVATLVFTSIFTSSEVWAQASWLMITLRRFAESLPLSTAQCWLVAAGAVGVAYLVMQERFTRLEATLVMLKKQKEADY